MAGKIVLVPTGLDDDDHRIGPDTGLDGGLPPVLVRAAGGLGQGVLLVLHRVVHDDEVGPLTGDRAARTGRHQPAVVALDLPVVGSSGAAVHEHAQLGGVLDLVPVGTAEVLRKSSLISGDDAAVVGVLGEVPPWHRLRDDGGLAVLRRGGDNEDVVRPLPRDGVPPLAIIGIILSGSPDRRRADTAVVQRMVYDSLGVAGQQFRVPVPLHAPVRDMHSVVQRTEQGTLHDERLLIGRQLRRSHQRYEIRFDGLDFAHLSHFQLAPDRTL